MKLATQEVENKINTKTPTAPLRKPSARHITDGEHTKSKALAMTQTLSPLVDAALQSEERANEVFEKLEKCIFKGTSRIDLPEQFGCLLGAHRLAKNFPGGLGHRFDDLMYQIPEELRDTFHELIQE